MYKILRPAFERNQQKFVTDDQGVGRFQYSVRRVCSQGCWQRETRRIVNDEQQLADRRPDLATAIEAKAKAELAEMPDEFNDDLGLNPGSY